MKRIFRFSGKNVSGGMHDSWFTIIADTKEEAITFIMKKIKDDIESDWKLYDDFKEEKIEKGIIDWDRGECC